MFVCFTKQHFHPLCSLARSWCLGAIFPTAVRALRNMELAGDCVTALTALGNTNSCTLQLSSYSQSSTSLFSDCAASPEPAPCSQHHSAPTPGSNRLQPWTLHSGTCPYYLEIVETQRALQTVPFPKLSLYINLYIFIFPIKRLPFCTILFHLHCRTGFTVQLSSWR